MFLITLQRIVPVFIIIFIGYIIGKSFKSLDITILAKTVIWVFANVIGFCYMNAYAPKLSQIAIYASGYFILMIFSIFIPLFMKKLKLIKDLDSGLFSLSLMFSNAGYVGFPVLFNLMGDRGVALAVVYVFPMTLISLSVGVIVLTGKIKEGIINMVKLPFLYGFIIGWILAMLGFNWKDSHFLIKNTLSMLNDSALTIILIYIGLSLSRIKLKKEHVKDLSMVTLFRLILLPLIAIPIGKIFGMEKDFLRVFVLESAMPVAMNVPLIAAEIDREASFASLIVLVSTALSFITIPIIDQIFLWVVR